MRLEGKTLQTLFPVLPPSSVSPSHARLVPK